jgi:hypothetical protein
MDDMALPEAPKLFIEAIALAIGNVVKRGLLDHGFNRRLTNAATIDGRGTMGNGYNTGFPSPFFPGKQDSHDKEPVITIISGLHGHRKSY